MRLFGAVCTYQFKRLPVLGSFLNSLFLAAMLLSAAIEGIQSCFHLHHTEGEGVEKILKLHPPRAAYPAMLAGFALVGAIMQWCSTKAHEMREEELESESLLNLRAGRHRRATRCLESGTPQHQLSELSAGQLVQADASRETQQPAESRESATKASLCPAESGGHASKRKFVLSAAPHPSFESVAPLDSNDHSQISLKSLKLVTPTIGNTTLVSISNALDDEARRRRAADHERKSYDRWLLVRNCASPVALLICALVFYLVDDGRLL